MKVWKARSPWRRAEGTLERDIEAKTERRTAQYDCRAGGAGRDIITNAEVDDGIGTG